MVFGSLRFHCLSADKRLILSRSWNSVTCPRGEYENLTTPSIRVYNIIFYLTFNIREFSQKKQAFGGPTSVGKILDKSRPPECRWRYPKPQLFPDNSIDPHDVAFLTQAKASYSIFLAKWQSSLKTKLRFLIYGLIHAHDVLDGNVWLKGMAWRYYEAAISAQY